MPFDANLLDYEDVSFATELTATEANIPAHTGFYRCYAKPALDVALILCSMVVILPILLVAAALIALDGHNPFYTQLRVGRNGTHFRMLKLRTMIPNAKNLLPEFLASNPAARDEWDATQKLKNDPRITRVGRFLRKTSIDELPQLFNVLKGDMALVGPRPMMIEQEALYHGRGYYNLRPGLTGLWQVSDRNECDFSDRVKFDEVYNRVVSLPLDIAVILRTFTVVARGTGY